MASTIKHPVFGDLVRDQWGDSLMSFRQLPHMRAFWYPNFAEKLAAVRKAHRGWVENWSQHTAELAKICRNSDVHDALQSLGVYEISIESPEDDASPPSDSQTAAFAYFKENEERVCRNMAEALLRYYRTVRERMPDWFDEDEDYPDDPTIEQLGEIVHFDGVTVMCSSSGEFSPLLAAWDPDWDPEHGLQMGVFKDEVIAIGGDDVTQFLQIGEAEFYLWRDEHLTDAERSMHKQFIAEFQAGRDED